MNKLKYILFATATCLMAFSSCSSDDNIATAPGIEGNVEDGAPAELTVRYALEGTRALSETNEAIVKDLALLTFNDRGNCNGFSYTRAPQGNFTLAGTNVKVKTRQGDNLQVFAVANVDGTTCDSAVLSKIETIEEFKKCAVTLSTASDLPNDNDITMFGSTTIASLSTPTGSTTVNLSRLATKFKFTIKLDSGVALSSFQLCHVPMSSYIWQENSYVKGNQYEYNPGLVYNNQPMVICSKRENSDPTQTLDTTIVLYTYENLVGQSSSSTTNALRTWENAPTNATYLNVTVLINVKDADQNLKLTEFPLRIYLGGLAENDYTNYDIPRNYQYTGDILVKYSTADNPNVVLPTLVTRNNTITNWNVVTDSLGMYNY